MANFLGMTGSGEWQTDRRPKNFRQGILRLFPNGNMALTGMTSMLKTETTDDYDFNWWTKGLPAYRAAVTEVYTDSNLTQAYASGAVAGSTLYFKMALAAAQQFRAGHTVTPRVEGTIELECVGIVTGRTDNGASSYVAVKLIEDDDNSSNYDISDTDILYILGNANAQGATIPDAIAYPPSKLNNFTQIFRNPVSVSRTERGIKLRGANSYEEKKFDAFQDHGTDIEKSMLFGVPYEGTGANGLPLTLSGGLLYWIRTNGLAANNVNFATSTDTDYLGKTWLEAGELFLDNLAKNAFLYGSDEKLLLAGNGAVGGINTLVKALGNFDYQAVTTDYGIKVMRWTTAHGVINIKTHPLLSIDATTTNLGVLFEPKDIVTRPFTEQGDTHFKMDDSEKKAGQIGVDGTKEEWLTELGWEFHYPEGSLIMEGIGVDNEVGA